MDVKVSIDELEKNIKAKKTERNLEVMEVFGVTPEWEKINLVAPQLAATINSIPGADVVFAAGVVSVGAMLTAVMHKHYATKDIKKLKELRDFASSLNSLEYVTEEQFYKDIEERKHL